MGQPQGSIWTERALVLLVMASLAGTVNLVITVHRREAAKRISSEPIPACCYQAHRARSESHARSIEPHSSPNSRLRRRKFCLQTHQSRRLRRRKIRQRRHLRSYNAGAMHELEEARKADRRAESLEQARQTAVAESQRWRRREMLVKQQLTTLAQKAHKIDREIDVLAAERDVLARERDSLKAALAKDSQKGSYAVLPYKGQNGTWRRPIVLECTNGTVTLRPKGPTFSMLDLSAMINPRSSPVVICHRPRAAASADVRFS